MSSLQLFADYGRGDVCAILAPDVQFQSQRGMWGVWGIVPLPTGDGDFAFFVTFGQRQGGHVFEEGIDANGILDWQSQPSQNLQTPTIRSLIRHDEHRHSIYLFVRTKKRSLYTHFGRLRYVGHDPHRECPVCFRWQVIDWCNESIQAAARIGLVVEPGIAPEAQQIEAERSQPTTQQGPKSRSRRRATTGMFRRDNRPE